LIIRTFNDNDTSRVFEIINNAAICYKGKIPADCWHEPYFPMEYLKSEIARCVAFHLFEEGGKILGCMGIQDVQDVTLIRHAYVLTGNQRSGIGSQLFKHLLTKATRPVLIGTWKAAVWAIAFYEKHGFILVSEEEKNWLLKKYWVISERQIETSVVLADQKYR
jgi:N-acetylglutamate synthase-like GNAT family acetyltransferase